MIEGDIAGENAGPVLRYPGSKHSLARRIVQMMPRHRRYLEPFMGSAAVLLAKPRSRDEIVNDRDDDIVNLFRILRDDALRAELVEAVELTPYAEAELKVLGGAATPTDDAVERARRFLVRSWFDIAGLRPHGHASSMRVPGPKTPQHRPASVWDKLPERISCAGRRLAGVEVLSRDAISLIESQNDPRVLIYADPPYLHSTRQSKSYYRHEMTDCDHERLLYALRRHPGPVLLSGYDSALYRSELESTGWRRHEMPGRAQNIRPGDPAKKEIVWANPAASGHAGDPMRPLFEVDGRAS